MPSRSLALLSSRIGKSVLQVIRLRGGGTGGSGALLRRNLSYEIPIFGESLTSILNRSRYSTSVSTSTNIPSPKVTVQEKEELSYSQSQPQSVKTKITPIQMGSAEMDTKDYILPLEQPVVNLDCTEAFNGLSNQEKRYAHFLSQAAWAGGLAVLAQTSPEAPLIFSILHDMFKSNGVEGLKSVAVSECSFTEDEWKALLVYTSGVFFNSGNYKGFGDTKILPGVPLSKLEQLVGKAKFLGLQSEIDSKWSAVKNKIYSLSEREKQLGLGEKGVTTYFSANCTLEDAEYVNRFLKSQKLEGWITRCFKKTEGTVNSYEIRSASFELDDGSEKTFDFEGSKVTLTKGDYSPLMGMVADNLHKAKEYASNETEKSMIDCYVKSFREGSIDAHKDGSRFWIKDKGPAIETYIGFIETYRDPTGTRGEFEGFVAVVNRPMSIKFNSLVDNATNFLKLLPWSVEFEKDTFMKPDFTSLDVLTFSGSGIPAGINIPNYDEIRQTEGFKNVSLGNVIPASYKDSVIPFLSLEDQAILTKYRVPAFELQVGLHELLGHGSGKLLKKNDDGTTNFPCDLKNPLTGELIESIYEHGDTYDTVFTDLGSAFEECRAECVGIFLSLDKSVVKIFGHEGQEADNIIYANWLSMVFAGAAKALEMYQPKTASWMQAHSRARFAIMQVLVEAGEGFVTIDEKTGADGKPDLLIKLDRSKIDTVGRKAIGDFLLKLQVYKSTADINSARKLFAFYTDINNDGKHPWSTWRDIIMDKKQPRKLFVQPNTYVEGESSATMKTYDATPEGLIQSWIERFPDNSIYKALDYCYAKDKPYF